MFTCRCPLICIVQFSYTGVLYIVHIKYFIQFYIKQGPVHVLYELSCNSMLNVSLQPLKSDHCREPIVLYYYKITAKSQHLNHRSPVHNHLMVIILIYPYKLFLPHEIQRTWYSLFAECLVRQTQKPEQIPNSFYSCRTNI